MTREANNFFDNETDEEELYYIDENFSEETYEEETENLEDLTGDEEDEFPNGEDENVFFDGDDEFEGDDDGDDWDWEYNATPVAVTDYYKVVRGGTLTGNVLDNDYDEEGDEISVDHFDIVYGASLEVDTDGSFIYVASETHSFYEDYDYFTYEITDASLYSGYSLGQVYIGYQDYEGQNLAPLSRNDHGYVYHNDITSFNLFDNDFDFENEQLNLSQINGTDVVDGETFELPSGALLTVNIDGSISYNSSTANDLQAYSELDAESGEDITYSYDNFSYNVVDESGNVTTAWVRVDYSDMHLNEEDDEDEENNSPHADYDDYTSQNSEIISGNFLDNDSDSDGDAFSLTHIDGIQITDGETIELASGALLTVYANGDFEYNLNENISNYEYFTYTITDENGGVDSADVTMNVYLEYNTEPDASMDEYTTYNGEVIEGNILENDYSPDYDLIKVTKINDVDITDGETITLASGALLTVFANGYFQYDPNGTTEEYEGFTYTIADEEGDEANSNVEIRNEYDLPNPPQAINDYAFVNENTTVAGNLLENDYEADGDNVFLSKINGVDIADGEVITLASGALLTVYTNGDYEYNPNGAFDGLTAFEYEADSFEYTSIDDTGFSSWWFSSATVNITVYGADTEVVTEDPDALYYTSELDGTEFDDSISGNSGNDSASGFAGDDILRGYRGDDTLHGGAGNDRVWGMDGDDIVIGGTGDDYVSGGNGDDVIIGSFGTDRLAGGTGEDTFLFFQSNTTPDETDLILDFESTVDTIEVYTNEQMSFDDLTITRIRDTKYTVSAAEFDFALTVQSDTTLTLTEGDFLFGVIV